MTNDEYIRDEKLALIRSMIATFDERQLDLVEGVINCLRSAAPGEDPFEVARDYLRSEGVPVD